MDLSGLSTPQRVSGIAIVVVAVAAFMPWFSVLGVGVLGIQGDGVITLALAILGGVVLATRTGLLDQVVIPQRPGLIASMVLAGLVALIGLLDVNGAAAIGLHLTLLGGISWLVGAILEFQAAKPEDVSSSGS